MSLIMRKAPLSWKTILVMESIKSTKALYTKVVDYEDDLLDAWRKRTPTSGAIIADNLMPTLKRLGWEQPKSQTNPFNHERLPQDRRVLLTTIEEDGNEEPTENPVNHTQGEAHDDILREVYHVMQKRPRAPPPGGYMFTCNDHVTTKMGKLPPSPCRACGSDNHWDKECPDYEIHRTRIASLKKSSYSTENDVAEGDKMYQMAFSILLSQCLAASQIDLDQVKLDFDVAVLPSEIDISNVELVENGHKIEESYKATMEEVEDEDVLHTLEKPKSDRHLLYHVDEDQLQEKPSRTKHPTQAPESCPKSELPRHTPPIIGRNEIHPGTGGYHFYD